MKLIQSGSIIAAALLSTVTIASAAGMMQQSNDHLTLTPSQSKTVFQAVNKTKPREQTAPTGFTASVGGSVPTTISLSRLPNQAAKEVPAIKSYDFAMLQNKLLIVNPKDRKIADVITQ